MAVTCCYVVVSCLFLACVRWCFTYIDIYNLYIYTYVTYMIVRFFDLNMYEIALEYVYTVYICLSMLSAAWLQAVVARNLWAHPHRIFLVPGMRFSRCTARAWRLKGMVMHWCCPSINLSIYPLSIYLFSFVILLSYRIQSLYLILCHLISSYLLWSHLLIYRCIHLAIDLLRVLCSMYMMSIMSNLSIYLSIYLFFTTIQG